MLKKSRDIFLFPLNLLKHSRNTVGDYSAHRAGRSASKGAEYLQTTRRIERDFDQVVPLSSMMRTILRLKTIVGRKTINLIIAQGFHVFQIKRFVFRFSLEFEMSDFLLWPPQN